jgi:DNA-binding NtrC family response regulator
MVTLTIEGSRGSELTYELNKPVISIGASSQNDVVVRSPGVAPRHLTIQQNDSVFTFLAQHRQVVVLNGERRSRGVLRVGDRLRIGTATVIFQGCSEEALDAGTEDQAPAATPPEAAAQKQIETGERPRSEVVLYSEPRRLAEARQHMVEVFRSGVPSDLIPSLRAFMENLFGPRQAMLAWRDNEGRFHPVVSQWTGEIPRLPARTFDEMGSGGRFAVLHLGARNVLLYPVERGPLQSQAYLVLETTDEQRGDDEIVLAELARLLAVNWERLENSASLAGKWETSARSQAEEHLPGTSHAIRLLRDSVIQAARSSYPALLCGRTGCGRMSTAALITSLHPTGPHSLHVFQGREGEDAALRMELFGPGADGEGGGSLMERARGGALILRDIQHLSPALQRETAAAIRHDLESGYGPTVRWLATTEEDCMGLLTEGVIDATLFNLFQRHIMRVPALEERPEDLPLLIVRLLNTVGSEQDKEIRGIELETLNSLLNHTFEGQMTELIAELRRLVSATPDGEMVRGIVPASPGAGAGASLSHDLETAAITLLSQDDLKTVVPAVEKLIIDRVLRRTLGNQSKAARILNLSRGALIAKMKEYDIPDYRYLRRTR